MNNDEFGRRRQQLQTAFPSADGFRQETAKLRFTVQMRGTWLWLAPAGQQESKSFQPFLRIRKHNALQRDSLGAPNLSTSQGAKES